MSADILSLKKLGRFATVLPSSSLLAFAAVIGVALPIADASWSPVVANEQSAVLPTTSVDDLIRMRDAWGKAPSQSPDTAPTVPAAVSIDPRAGSTGYAVLPTSSVADLLAMRDAWGDAPSAFGNPAPSAVASTESAVGVGYALLPTTNVADVLSMREGWGEGKPSTMEMPPLATGSYSPLPQDKMELPPGPASAPIVHAFAPTPAPELQAVPQDVLERAMKALLAERDGWRSPPAAAPAASATPAAAPPAAAPPAAPPAAAPAAAAAATPAAAPAAVAAAAPPTSTAAPAVAAAADGRAVLPTTSVVDLIRMRDAWGTAPTAVRTAAAPAPAPAAVAAPAAAAATAAPAAAVDAANCEARLRQIAQSGLIQFESSSAKIDAKSNATLDAIAAAAKSCKKGKIRVGGHTDASGRAAANKTLSTRRAEAVAQYLRKAGVPNARLEAVGFGQDRPVASNATPEGRAQNRRIEFSVVE